MPVAGVSPSIDASIGRGRILLRASLMVSMAFSVASAQDDLRVWREFVSLVRSGTMTVDRIRPHQELEDSKHRLLGYLEIARKQALPHEWEADPEVIRRDSLLHYIISLT
ncbi:MAG: hypothetical protein IH628_07585, partial [Proteobacteria bacterium]|nr:hypothetical protein [Pseudomonadota bacterium]